jgi:hypothetical protein
VTRVTTTRGLVSRRRIEGLSGLGLSETEHITSFKGVRVEVGLGGAVKEMR